MNFKVYYNFYDSSGHCTRGGETMRVTVTNEEAEQSVYDVLVNTPEYKDGNTLNIHSVRMFSEYLSWNEAIKTMANLGVLELAELVAAANALKRDES